MDVFNPSGVLSNDHLAAKKHSILCTRPNNFSYGTLFTRFHKTVFTIFIVSVLLKTLHSLFVGLWCRFLQAKSIEDACLNAIDVMQR